MQVKKFQAGGSAEQQMMAQAAQLVKAAMSGDPEATAKVQQIMQMAQMIEAATKQLEGGAEAGVPISKCGSKLKKKMEEGAKVPETKKPIKKACGGKKMQDGSKLPVNKPIERGFTTSKSYVKIGAKGGKPCPCQLKRVGGKVVTVDCNGMIVPNKRK